MMPDDLQRILHSFLQDHSRNLSTYTNKDILLEPISTNNAALKRAIDQLKKNAKQQNQTKGLLYPTIPNRVGQLSEKRVTEIFGLSAADIAHPTKTPEPQLTDEEQAMLRDLQQPATSQATPAAAQGERADANV